RASCSHKRSAGLTPPAHQRGKPPSCSATQGPALGRPKLSSETAGQGSVGTWPGSSCASRAALSLASCARSSLGTNLPCVVDGAVGLGLAAVVVAALATIALPLVTAAPITPPTSIEAAIAPPASAVLSRIMVFTSFFALAQTGHLARSCRGALKARCQEPVNLARTGSRLLWTRGQA